MCQTIILKIYLFYAYECFAYTYKGVPYAYCAHRGPEEASGPLEIESDNCEPPCGCSELNPSPLQEQPGLLITDPSL